MRHIVPAAFCRLGFVSYIWDQNRKTYEKTPVLPRGGSPLRLWRSRGLYQFHRNQRGIDRRLGHGLLCRRFARALRRPIPHPRREIQGRGHAARLRVGHGTLPDGHPPGGADLVDRRQHERAFAHHRRNDLRRPPGTGGLDRADRLRVADLHHAPARQDRPRGDPHDRRAGEHLRICLERRVVLDRRPRRGVDHGADRQGLQGRRQGRQRPQGHRMGSPPHPRRLCLGARQPGAYHDLPEGRPRELPLFARRGGVRPRDGLLRRHGRGFQFLRSLRPGRFRRAARLRGPRVGILPHGGRRNGQIRGLCDGAQCRKPHAPVGETPHEGVAQGGRWT